MSYVVSIFGFFKCKLYFALSEESTCYKCIDRFLTIMFIIYGALIFVMFIMIDSGPNVDDGLRTCFTLSMLNFYFQVLSSFLFITLNIVMITIFYLMKNVRDDSIPGLQNQMLMNFYVIPFLFGTTLLICYCMIAFVSYATSSNLDNSTPVFFYIFSSGFDNLINSVVMYWSIFGTIDQTFWDMFGDDWIFDVGDSTHIQALDPSQETDESSSSTEESTNQVPGMNRKSTDELQYVWLGLPGVHPVKVRLSVVCENRMEKYIIWKPRKLKQIRWYRRRGFVRSLMCCCESTEDLMRELDIMHGQNISLFTE